MKLKKKYKQQVNLTTCILLLAARNSLQREHFLFGVRNEREPSEAKTSSGDSEQIFPFLGMYQSGASEGY